MLEPRGRLPERARRRRRLSAEERGGLSRPRVVDHLQRPRGRTELRVRGGRVAKRAPRRAKRRFGHGGVVRAARAGARRVLRPGAGSGRLAARRRRAGVPDAPATGVPDAPDVASGVGRIGRLHVDLCRGRVAGHAPRRARDRIGVRCGVRQRGRGHGRVVQHLGHRLQVLRSAAATARAARLAATGRATGAASTAAAKLPAALSAAPASTAACAAMGSMAASRAPGDSISASARGGRFARRADRCMLHPISSRLPVWRSRAQPGVGSRLVGRGKPVRWSGGLRAARRRFEQLVRYEHDSDALRERSGVAVTVLDAAALAVASRTDWRHSLRLWRERHTGAMRRGGRGVGLSLWQVARAALASWCLLRVPLR